MTDETAAMFRALIAAIFLIGLPVVGHAQTSAEVATYERAVKAMRLGDWRAALITAESAGPVARDIIEWHRLRSGLGGFDDALLFLDRRPDWPGLKLLRRASEDGLPLGSRPEDVLHFFSAERPQTGAGAVALIAALRVSGREAEAQSETIRAWRGMILSEADEKLLLGTYGDLLKGHHEARLDMLVWRGARQTAERMYPRVGEGWRALAEARLALRSSAPGVDGLIEKVPAELADDPGLAFERMQWRARKGRNEDAIALMLSRSPDTLGDPERWAGWRRGLARAEMREGRTDTAYRLAAGHGLTEGSNFADLEWLAGYIALTYQSDAAKALGHFLRFRGAVETPISLGRAGYWEGRAHEMLGDPDTAQLAYAFGAEYQTSFYGLLAAEKAGVPLDPSLVGQSGIADWSATSFAKSSVFEAARLFIAAGERNLAEQFLRHLTEALTPDEIASLGAYALDAREPHLAVMIGKQAAEAGIVVPSAYFPLVRLGVDPMPVPEELALSIARRESEFDPVVQSGVGARGLMQLMPGTARDVARYLDIPYSHNRLITDPVYNARLGTAYLDELLEMFDGNIVMTSAGYNAGPGRPLRWMEERGDPRRGGLDIVDWIEHIPFNETRNYVMRVAESVVVYRARLSGETGPVSLSSELVAMPGHVRTAEKGNFVRPEPRPGPLTD